MGFRPANKQELFNLWHAQAQNIIEHIFGVLKQHFCILVIPPEYSVQVQAQIPPALCAIHNTIKIHEPDDGKTTDLRSSEYSSSIPNPGDNGVWQMNYVEDDVALHQDKIAQNMWDSYQTILQTREGRRRWEWGWGWWGWRWWKSQWSNISRRQWFFVDIGGTIINQKKCQEAKTYKLYK